MRRTWTHGGFVAAASALVLVSLLGCGAGGGAGSDVSSAVKEKPTLEEFLDADSKTGEFTVVRTNEDGTVTEMNGEFWVDGRLFRYSLYQDGKLVRDIMSPDGKTAYFVEHEGKYCEPSVASVDRYLLEFADPGAEAVEDGVDEQTGAKRIVYPVKALDDLTGADNAWYTEDVTYLVKDDAVIGVITRGDTPNQDGTYDLDEARRLFSNLKVGERIPPETFELPYPITEGD